jgi:hypothetical protein
MYGRMSEEIYFLGALLRTRLKKKGKHIFTFNIPDSNLSFKLEIYSVY